MLLLFFLDLSTLDIIYSSKKSIDKALTHSHHLPSYVSFLPNISLFLVHLFFTFVTVKKSVSLIFLALSILDRTTHSLRSKVTLLAHLFFPLSLLCSRFSHPSPSSADGEKCHFSRNELKFASDKSVVFPVSYGTSRLRM